MSELIDYRGNCHCGAFKFTFKAPEIKETHVCNCSNCYKNGYLWGSTKDLVVVKGDMDHTLRNYKFGNHRLQFKFCPTCGTSVLARMPDGGIALNLRTLDNFDATILPVASVTDGAAMEPPYQVPKPVDVGPVTEGTTVYQGSCHCGAVRYAHLSPKPLTAARECNCSICHRYAVAWTYPETTTVVFEGSESLVEYTFGLRWRLQGFCGVCGVTVREMFLKEGTGHEMGLNVRSMNGVDLNKLTLTMLDAKSYEPAYDAGW